MVHFAGVFAPRAKLRRQVVPRPVLSEAEGPVAAAAPAAMVVPSVAPEATPRKPRLEWAALLRRVFALDVLRCSCGGERKIVAFITDVRVVRDILEHLELRSKPLPWASAQAPPQLEWVA